MLIMLKSLRAQRDEGFTMLELMIVVVILAVIMGIAIPIYVNNKKTAVAGAAKTEVADIAILIATGVTNQSLVVSSTDGHTPLTGRIQISAYSREVKTALVYVLLNSGNYTYCASESDGKGAYWVASDSSPIHSSPSACSTLA